MVATENHEVVEGRHQLIDTDFIDSEEANQNGSIDYYGSTVSLFPIEYNQPKQEYYFLTNR